MTQIASKKITFPDKSLYSDKIPVEISQILSLSEKEAKVLCGHVEKIHKNCPLGYSEMGPCFCIPSSQKRKERSLPSGNPMSSFQGKRSLASQGSVNSLLSAPLCRRENVLWLQDASQLARAGFLV